jgi:hypothetical protein
MWGGYGAVTAAPAFSAKLNAGLLRRTVQVISLFLSLSRRLVFISLYKLNKLTESLSELNAGQNFFKEEVLKHELTRSDTNIFASTQRPGTGREGARTSKPIRNLFTADGRRGGLLRRFVNRFFGTLSDLVWA